ncbi:hypothetical protein [Acetanaerobacterium elongatum]|uniref:Lipoprotein n=1 Tax=Acetanaerobacterium elongatum TaxID=258515 RepID=A0A1H0GM39_9FIRM|nr:hypothetical protein [Acetanaerobacterium elongatum]SDO07832.1 hypothetical protein SAMN05192585_15210 [Acetanaerobacterium elongatum]
MKKRRLVYCAVMILLSIILYACSPTNPVSNICSSSDATPPISSVVQAESSSSVSEEVAKPPISSEVQAESSSSLSEEVVKAAKTLEVAAGFDTTVTKLDDSGFPPDYQESGYDLFITTKNVNGVWKYADLYGNVLPYDQIMRAYQFDRLGSQVTDSVLYVQKDGEWSAIELKDRILVSFRPKKDAPASFVSDFDVIVYKGKTLYVKYYGQPTTLPLELFFPAFNRQEFKLYANSKYIGSYQGNLTGGEFEDEILFDFKQGGSPKGCEGTAVLGSIEPIAMETAKPDAKVIPKEYKDKLTPELPMHAIKLKDTEVTLFDFFYTKESKSIYHVFAVSTPQVPYKEVYVVKYAINHLEVEPIADYLFAGKNRNGEYLVLCRTIGKGGDNINVFQFKG